MPFRFQKVIGNSMLKPDYRVTLPISLNSALRAPAIHSSMEITCVDLHGAPWPGSLGHSVNNQGPYFQVRSASNWLHGFRLGETVLFQLDMDRPKPEIVARRP